jgi:hypothetical protein
MKSWKKALQKQTGEAAESSQNEPEVRKTFKPRPPSRTQHRAWPQAKSGQEIALPAIFYISVEDGGFFIDILK